MSYFRKLLALSRPSQLFSLTLTYVLGAGISRYLGRTIRLADLLLGLLMFLALHIATCWFVEYFRLPLTPLGKGETARSREAFRITLLQSSFAALTIAAAFIVTLLLTRSMPFAAGIILGLSGVLFFVYSIPPFRLFERGYGEVVLAIIFGTLIPAWSFLLQFGEFQRLLTFVTFPLTLLALVYLLVCDFPTYATDLKLGRNTLLTRLTWQYAIPIHHVLLLAAFLLFAISPSLGFPWRLDWPVFLALPFGIAQVLWLQRIARGGRPLWNLFLGLALASFGFTAYILAFTFWTH
jgi:1,4-dihydroxy-2-naphthoate octaprenyltransferase